MSDQYKDERRLYHSGHAALGYNTLVALYPREQLGIVILVNDDIDQDRVSEAERATSAALNRR